MSKRSDEDEYNSDGEYVDDDIESNLVYDQGEYIDPNDDSTSVGTIYQDETHIIDDLFWTMKEELEDYISSLYLPLAQFISTHELENLCKSMRERAGFDRDTPDNTR